MRHAIIAVIVAITFTPGAPPVSAQEMTAQQFVTLAAIGGLAEVQLGRLAFERAGRPSVQQFGQRMVLDHAALTAELARIAERKDMSMPVALDDAHQQKKGRIAGLWGHDFDRVYMQETVADHIKAIAHFEAEAQAGIDPDLKGFATAALPVLRQHLELARNVHTQVVLGPVEPVQPAASPMGAPSTSWCAGAHAPTAGTNFGGCIAK